MLLRPPGVRVHLYCGACIHKLYVQPCGGKVSDAVTAAQELDVEAHLSDEGRLIRT